VYRIRYNGIVQHDEVAGSLIRDMRLRAGLTQAALARRARIPRPVLSAYENGRRQPSVAILSRLARAVGLRLELTPTIDLARNGARFADALTIVDAMPVPRRRTPLPRPIDWKR
jgi:transcriptional regulator with XRE-family HTH domain